MLGINNQQIIFLAKLWIYSGKGSWFFVTLPKKESGQIKSITRYKRRGWGSISVDLEIGKTQWKTSIFPDSKAGAYLLPIKADVRKKGNLEIGDMIKVHLKVLN